MVLWRADARPAIHHEPIVVDDGQGPPDTVVRDGVRYAFDSSAVEGQLAVYVQVVD